MRKQTESEQKEKEGQAGDDDAPALQGSLDHFSTVFWRNGS